MVETARLERVYTLTGIESSNLSLSAIIQEGSYARIDVCFDGSSCADGEIVF